MISYHRYFAIIVTHTGDTPRPKAFFTLGIPADENVTFYWTRVSIYMAQNALTTNRYRVLFVAPVLRLKLLRLRREFAPLRIKDGIFVYIRSCEFVEEPPREIDGKIVKRTQTKEALCIMVCRESKTRYFNWMVLNGRTHEQYVFK